jgi:hypothetical protein
VLGYLLRRRSRRCIVERRSHGAALNRPATPPSAATTPAHQTPPTRGSVAGDLRILAGALAAGALVGLLFNGVGTRLAMRLLFLLNTDVRGRLSDDGFVMGQFSVVDTLELVAFGTFVGTLGSMVYLVLRPLRTGHRAFDASSLVVGPAVVVGNMLVHSNGIDFRLLKPTTLAIGLFVALPAASAAATVWLVERWLRPDAWPQRSRGGWLAALPLALPLGFGLPPLVAIIGRVAYRQIPAERAAPIVSWARRLGQAALVAIFAYAAVGLATTCIELLGLT